MNGESVEDTQMDDEIAAVQEEIASERLNKRDANMKYGCELGDIV